MWATLFADGETTTVWTVIAGIVALFGVGGGGYKLLTWLSDHIERRRLAAEQAERELRAAEVAKETTHTNEVNDLRALLTTLFKDQLHGLQASVAKMEAESLRKDAMIMSMAVDLANEKAKSAELEREAAKLRAKTQGA